MTLVFPEVEETGILAFRPCPGYRHSPVGADSLSGAESGVWLANIPVTKVLRGADLPCDERERVLTDVAEDL